MAAIMTLVLARAATAESMAEPTDAEIESWAGEARANPKRWGRPPKDREKFFTWVEKRVCAMKGFCREQGDPIQLIPYSHDENGCSAPTGDLWFRNPCNGHDNCYQHGFQCGQSRRQCDEQFLSDMLDVCSSVGNRRCRPMARIYYAFVRAFGWRYYHVDPWTNAGGATLTCSPQVSDCSSYALAPQDMFCHVYIDPELPVLQCPDGTVTFRATGGRGPYVWYSAAGKLIPSGTNDALATLAPPDGATEGDCHACAEQMAGALVTVVDRDGHGAQAVVNVADCTGTLVGSVVDASSGEPLSGAQVSVADAAASTTTDGSGSYVLVSVPAGPVTVSAGMSCHVQASLGAEVVAGQTTTLDFALEPQQRSVEVSGGPGDGYLWDPVPVILSAALYCDGVAMPTSFRWTASQGQITPTQSGGAVFADAEGCYCDVVITATAEDGTTGTTSIFLHY